MGNKKKQNKLLMTLTLISFSVGGINLLNLNVGNRTDPADITTTVEENNPPETEISKIEQPINESFPIDENLPEDTESEQVDKTEDSPMNPIVIVLNDSEKKTDDIKENYKPITPVPNTNNNNDNQKSIQLTDEGTETFKTTINDINGNEVVDEKTEQNENSTSKGVNFEDENETLQTKSSCQLNIDTPSQLVLVTDSEIDQNGTVNISYVNSETEEITYVASYGLCQIVNADEDSSGSEKINYMDMPSGEFIFKFENCSFEDIDFYLVDFEESLLDNDPNNNEDEIQNITIPSQSEFEVKIDQDNSLCRIGLMPSCTFQPLITFWSEEYIGVIIRIIDDSENELFNIDIEQIDNNTKSSILPFKLEEGKQYYLEINSSSIEELLEYTYYFKISSVDSEENT